MIEVKNLSVTYPSGVHALIDANMRLSEDGIWGILGANGSGKTTLLKAILGLVPTKGTALYRGKPLKNIAKETAYVEQKAGFDMDFPITVFDCVLMGTYPRLGLFKNPGKKEKTSTIEAIKKVGLLGMEKRQIGQLSGGQFQRVLIARMLVQNAKLIILDEPFVGIDVNSEKIILNLLKELAKQDRTILIVHHDLSKVRDYFDNIILINRTIIDYGKVEDVFTTEKLKQTFEIYSDLISD